MKALYYADYAMSAQHIAAARDLGYDLVTDDEIESISASADAAEIVQLLDRKVQELGTERVLFGVVRDVHLRARLSQTFTTYTSWRPPRAGLWVSPTWVDEYA